MCRGRVRLGKTAANWRDQVDWVIHSAMLIEGCSRLLRNRANRGFAVRCAEVDEYPLPRRARLARLNPLAGCIGTSSSLQEYGTPRPLRIYSRCIGRESNPARLLHGVEEKIGASPNNNDRKTRRQKRAHDLLRVDRSLT